MRVILRQRQPGRDVLGQGIKVENVLKKLETEFQIKGIILRVLHNVCLDALWPTG